MMCNGVPEQYRDSFVERLNELEARGYLPKLSEDGSIQMPAAAEPEESGRTTAKGSAATFQLDEDFADTLGRRERFEVPLAPLAVLPYMDRSPRGRGMSDW
ncbi:unnamed protein product [Polarella glacialis]|uniref:Uncharacterized protein n=1 Tax=Polarella glacialis TaxID=89957 RepID=A0A813JGA6_POLGL|nr:unnamed protein product [Polarella glacialis]